MESSHSRVSTGSGSTPFARSPSPAPSATASCVFPELAMRSLLLGADYRPSGAADRPRKAANSLGQSKAGPGSVLRPGAISAWPTMRDGDNAG